MTKNSNFILTSLIILIVLTLTSCAERKFTIHTIPDKVNCEINGRPLGQTPITIKYVENGFFRIRLSKEGYDIFNGQFRLKKKWFNQLGLDFIGEILPKRFLDDQTVEFTMVPITKISHEEFKNKIDEQNSKVSK